MLRRLLKGTRPQDTTLQTRRGAAFCYEDVVTKPEAAGEPGTACWTLERIQTQYEREGQSQVRYDRLPVMREGHSPAGWDAWG